MQNVRAHVGSLPLLSLSLRAAIFLLRRYAGQDKSEGMWQFTPAWQLSFSLPEGSQTSEARLFVCNVGLCTEEDCATPFSPAADSRPFNGVSGMTPEPAPPASLGCVPVGGARSVRNLTVATRCRKLLCTPHRL